MTINTFGGLALSISLLFGLGVIAGGYVVIWVIRTILTTAHPIRGWFIKRIENAIAKGDAASESWVRNIYNEAGQAAGGTPVTPFDCWQCSEHLDPGYAGGFSCQNCNAWYNVTPFGSQDRNPNGAGPVFALADNVPGIKLKECWKPQ